MIQNKNSVKMSSMLYEWPIAPAQLTGRGSFSVRKQLHRCWYLPIGHGIGKIDSPDSVRVIEEDDIDLGFLYNDIHVTIQQANNEIWDLQLWGILESPELMIGEHFMSLYKNGYFIQEDSQACRKVSYVCVVRSDAEEKEGQTIMRITQMGYDIPLSLNVIYFMPSFMHFEVNKEVIQNSLIISGHISGEPLR